MQSLPSKPYLGPGWWGEGKSLPRGNMGNTKVLFPKL